MKSMKKTPCAALCLAIILALVGVGAKRQIRGPGDRLTHERAKFFCRADADRNLANHFVVNMEDDREAGGLKPKHSLSQAVTGGSLNDILHELRPQPPED